MPSSGPRIFLIDGPVDQAVEEHGGSSRQQHAEQHENQDAWSWPAVCRHEESAESKRKRENRVRETDQAQEAPDGTRRWWIHRHVYRCSLSSSSSRSRAFDKMGMPRATSIR